MELFISIIRIVLLVSSFLGYVIFVNKKLNIKPEFAPLLIVAGIVVLEFISGILNIMVYTNFLILLGGIVLFIKTIVLIINSNKKSIYIKRVLNIKLIVIAVLFLFFTVMTSKLHLLHFDNFTHWALVVEDMLASNKLPNFESNVIMFRSYPLGSALFIYYFCYFAGAIEKYMMIAQCIIFLSGMITLFAFVDNTKKKNWMFNLLIVALVLLFSIFNISFNELLVDTLLSSVGIGAVAILVYYNKDLKKSAICSTILSTFLIMIKNSGIYFYAINSLIILYIAIKGLKSKAYNKKEIKEYLLICLLVPLFSIFIWKRHLLYAYGQNAKMGFHSMSVKSYGKNLLVLASSKSDFVKIAKVFLFTIFDLKNIVTKSIIIIDVLFVLYMLLMKLITKECRKIVLRFFIFSNVIYILYLIGTFGMYIFSMPLNEAVRLAGYHRYVLTIIQFILALLVLAIMIDSKNIEDKKSTIVINVFTLILSFICILGIYTSNNKKSLVGIDDYEGSYKQKFDNIKSEYKLQKDKSYAICSLNTETYSAYLRCVSIYSLKTHNVSIITELNEENIRSLKDCDYIIVLDGLDYLKDILENREHDFVLINIMK